MREILFKAKRVDNGEWVEGSYVWDDRDKRAWIVYYWEDGERNFEVDPSTVCQYTGLKDKNGERIFEGDEVSYKYYKDYGQSGELIDREPVFVKWSNSKASFSPFYYWEEYHDQLKTCELTGRNIHNKEQ